MVFFEGDVFFASEHSFLKGHLEVIAEIVASSWAIAASAGVATPEEIRKDVSEQVTKPSRTEIPASAKSSITSGTRASINPAMAKLVIHLAFLRVSKDLI